MGYRPGEVTFLRPQVLPRGVKPMKIVERDPSKLVPYARNAKEHPAEQIARLAGAIKEFGFKVPVLIDEEDVIISGHGRVMAALQLGMSKVPCHICADMSETDRRAFRIADNKLAERGRWDDAMLGLELADLSEMGVDLEGLGFESAELGKLLTDGSEKEGEDETPELDEENVVSKPGDVWILGDHRLMCGDSTSADDVAKLLGKVKPHLMVTDPPYGVEYDANWRNERVREDGSPIAGRAIGKVQNDQKADWREAWALFPGDVAYVWHAGLRAREVVESLEAAGFVMRAQIIWSKGRFAIGRGDYHFQHEPCWYAVRKGKKGHWAGDRSQSTIWQISHSKSETGHSTQKPVECMRRPIVNNSSPGQAVYEPFSGSGTTIIAAETTGRACYAMELHPPYVDLAVRRWQEFTGKTAVLEATGEPFPAG